MEFVSSMFRGISVKIYFQIFVGFRLVRFDCFNDDVNCGACMIVLYRINQMIIWAAHTEWEACLFTAELSIETALYSENTFKYFSWFMLCFSTSLVFSEMTEAGTMSLIDAKDVSTRGCVCSWRRRRSFGKRFFLYFPIRVWPQFAPMTGMQFFLYMMFVQDTYSLLQ